MSLVIKDFRDATGLSQKEFAETYGIPVSTLRKWEQGESKPASYFVSLLARSIPGLNHSLRTVEYKDGTSFFYDEIKSTVADRLGNTIAIHESLEGVKEENLGLYLHDLFEDFYKAREKFERDCRYDKVEDIIWS